MMLRDAVYFLVVTGALAILACLARWIVATAALKREAAEDYAYRAQHRPASVSGIDAASYQRLYVASHQPRWALYVGAAIFTAGAATPLGLLIVALLYDGIWMLSGAPAWAGPLTYPRMFAVFFGLALVWALAVAIFARLHYTRAPEPWRFALARARGAPIPDEPTWRRRPKWAKRVRPEGGEGLPSQDA